jgi:hypothetical protein
MNYKLVLILLCMSFGFYSNIISQSETKAGKLAHLKARNERRRAWHREHDNDFIQNTVSKPIVNYTHKNRFAALEVDNLEQIEEISFKQSETNLQLNDQENKKTIPTRFASYQTSWAHLPKSQRMQLIEIIQNDLIDCSDSDESDEEGGITLYFGPENYSVHRENGLFVKTHHVQQNALNKYINNLEIAKNPKKCAKGSLLSSTEVAELLEREKKERPHHAK